MPPRSPSGDDDERSPRTPREEDARSTASSQRSARKDDDDVRSTTSSRRSARKTPRANEEDDDDLASVQSEQDAAVAKARALRLLLAFEDSGHKLRDVLKNKDYDAEALLDAQLEYVQSLSTVMTLDLESSRKEFEVGVPAPAGFFANCSLRDVIVGALSARATGTTATRASMARDGDTHIIARALGSLSLIHISEPTRPY